MIVSKCLMKHGIYCLTYPLDSLPLLLSNTDLLGAGRQRNILIGVLGQQLHELLWVLGNHLGELRVASSNLLENGLEHLRLLLNDLAQLLELRVVAQEIKSVGTSGTTSKTGCGSCAGASASSA